MAVSASSSSPRPSPIRQDSSRADRVTSQLRDAILGGQYPAGTRLPPERELAERLQVGRSTVREALQRLEQMGVLRIRHGEGVTVLPLFEANIGVLPHLIRREGHVDVELVSQLLEVQEALLSAAARLAVEQGTVEHQERARRLLHRIADPTLGEADYFETHSELVSLMTTASRNLVMRLVRKALWTLVFREGDAPGGRLRPPQDVLAPLVKDLDAAIRDGDPHAAQEATRGLVRAHANYILEGLREASDEEPAK